MINQIAYATEYVVEPDFDLDSPSMDNVAIGYARMSSKTQTDGEASIESQNSAIVKYCTENNYVLEQTFTDVSNNGEKLERQALENARQYCRDHVGRLSRFIIYDSRDVNSLLLFLEEIETLSIQVERVKNRKAGELC